MWKSLCIYSPSFGYSKSVDLGIYLLVHSEPPKLLPFQLPVALCLDVFAPQPNELSHNELHRFHQKQPRSPSLAASESMYNDIPVYSDNHNVLEGRTGAGQQP